MRKRLLSNAGNRSSQMQDLSIRALPKHRPEPTEADIIHERSAKTAVGPEKAGVVLAVDAEIGTGYVKDCETGQTFALIRKLVSSRAFDSLRAGDTVRFRENGRRAVAVIVP